MADEPSLTPVEGLRVTWDAAAVAALLQADDAEPSVPWHLEGSLDPRFELLRVISGATADGSAVFVCAARPAGAERHDVEAVAALVTTADGDDKPIEEALVSTEYARDGTIRRLGLELYKEGDDYPMRGAGDAMQAATSETAGERHARARLRFRLDGSEGAALYEIVKRI